MPAIGRCAHKRINLVSAESMVTVIGESFVTSELSNLCRNWHIDPAPPPPLSTAVIRARHGLPAMEVDPRIPRTAASLLQAIFPFERL